MRHTKVSSRRSSSACDGAGARWNRVVSSVTVQAPSNTIKVHVFDRGLTFGASGNLSVRLADGWLMTPTGCTLGAIDPARIARLDEHDEWVSGDKPTKESVLHLTMHRQAGNSLDLEPGCRYFDVAEDPHDPTLFFLYELYQDETAFRKHLDSNHFQNFSETVSPWIKSKLTKTLVRTWPPEGHQGERRDPDTKKSRASRRSPAG